MRPGLELESRHIRFPASMIEHPADLLSMGVDDLLSMGKKHSHDTAEFCEEMHYRVNQNAKRCDGYFVGISVVEDGVQMGLQEVRGITSDWNPDKGVAQHNCARYFSPTWRGRRVCHRPSATRGGSTAWL